MRSGEASVVAGLLSSLGVFGLVGFSASASGFCGFVQAEAFSLRRLAVPEFGRGRGNEINQNERPVCQPVKQIHTQELFQAHGLTLQLFAVVYVGVAR